LGETPQLGPTALYTEFVMHENRVMTRNITIAIEDELARQVRVLAAERDLSVSRYIANLIERELSAAESSSGDSRSVEERDRYDSAMNSYLARRDLFLSDPLEPYPSKEEIHDRPGLR
jgi:hypothetical protein